MPERREIIAMIERSELLIQAEEVQSAYDRMANWIEGQSFDCPVLIAVLNGALRTAGELMRRLQGPLELECLRVTRYRDAVKGGTLDWAARPLMDLEGRDLLIVDDVLEGGESLHAVCQQLQFSRPRSLRTLALVQKAMPRPARIRADLAALRAPDRFLLGEGMDLAGLGRNLRGIWALQPGDQDEYLRRSS